MCSQADIRTESAESGDAGFSLLETLVALAIMAVASLALFQSTTAMLSVSDRAVNTAERTLQNALDRRAIDGLLSSLIPAWKEETAAEFTGSATRLSGITSQSLSTASYGAARFTLYLERDNSGTLQLIYGDELPAAKPSRGAGNNTAPSRWVIQSSLPAAARFAYQDTQKTWHESWPPPPPRTSSTVDALLGPTALPQTIALRVPAANRAQGQRYIFQVPVTHHPQLPPRDRI